jgi:hypothetical protein
MNYGEFYCVFDVICTRTSIQSEMHNGDHNGDDVNTVIT